MSFIVKWREFSQKLWKGFGSQLQGWYDAIDKLDYSPGTKALLQKLCDALPPGWAILILKHVKATYKKHGKEAAERIVKQILEILKHFSF